MPVSAAARGMILLLHGLGATGAVWNGVRQVIEQRSLGRSIAPDLGGHGDRPGNVTTQWVATQPRSQSSFAAHKNCG